MVENKKFKICLKTTSTDNLKESENRPGSGGKEVGREGEERRMNELDINKIVPHCHLPNSVWCLYISNSMILWYISIHVFYFILLICTFLQENHFSNT